MYKKLLLPVCILLVSFLSAQPTVKVLTSGKRVSFRGLSVVSDKVVWASGSSGTVARSVDGGANWEWITVPGYEKRDFRDIEAFDKNTAIIVGIAEPAVILKTTDAGKNWEKVFEDTTKGMFLDAMDFSPDGKTGIVIGDPLPGAPYPYLLYSKDRGNNWEKIHTTITNPIPLADGEAFFASSGSNIKMISNTPWWVYVSGGKSSKAYVLFKDAQNNNTWKYYTDADVLPIMQGAESTGANSIAMIHASGNSYNAVVVGGDFSKDTIASNNCVLFTMHGKLFDIRQPKTPPHGYRSSVIYLDKKNLVTCGTSGIDISKDGGDNWELISREKFHVCQKAKKGKAVFLAGGGGRIAKLEY